MEYYRFAIILVVIMNDFHKIDAKLTLIPRNTEVKNEDTTYMNCSTSLNANQIQWRRGSNYVYTGVTFLEPYNDGRFSVDINPLTGACNLVVSSVQPSDAGTYDCVDDYGLGEQRTAQLIVLDDDPVCRSNMHSDGVTGPNSCGIEPEEIKFSCSVKYYGNSLPVLQWKANATNESITDGRIDITSINNEVTYTLTMKATLGLNNSSFICHTTRTSDKHYSCSSDAINILYVFSGEVSVNMTMNDKVNCLANTSQLCSYKWKWFNDDDSSTESNNQILKPKKVGMHRCEATCSIRNESCSVQSMYAMVYLEEATSGQRIMPWLTLLLAPVLAAIGVIVYRWRKRKIRKRQLDEIERQRREDEVGLGLGLQRRLLEIRKQQLDEIEPQRREDKADLQRRLLAAEILRLDEIELQRRENEERPKLLGLIATIRTKAAEKMGQKIRGLAILDEELFVVSRESSEVEVYDSTNFSFSRQWTLEKLIDPMDIVSCHINKCLYTSDDKIGGLFKEIFRVDLNGELIKKWSTKNDCGFLSVTYDSNVILVVFHQNKLNEYSPDGQLIREIRLSSEEGFCHLWHAIKLTNGHFVVCHGSYDGGDDNDLHRVCLVDVDGELLKSFGGKRGSTISETHGPWYLSVHGSGSVMVADYCNSRILLLDSNLEFQREILSYEHGLRYPHRILLDESHSRVFVSVIERNNYRILIFDLGLLRQTRNVTLNS